MIITKNKVVTIDYTLKNDNGEVLDTSKDREPITYIHGMKHIIPGLQNALEGRKRGESFSVSIRPEDAYGVYNKQLHFQLEKEKFDQIENLTIGMHVRLGSKFGEAVFTIKAIEDNIVKLDGNHPLAGETLHYDITIKDVRDATKEEIEHKHVH